MRSRKYPNSLFAAVKILELIRNCMNFLEAIIKAKKCLRFIKTSRGISLDFLVKPYTGFVWSGQATATIAATLSRRNKLANFQSRPLLCFTFWLFTVIAAKGRSPSTQVATAGSALLSSLQPRSLTPAPLLSKHPYLTQGQGMNWTRLRPHTTRWTCPCSSLTSSTAFSC